MSNIRTRMSPADLDSLINAKYQEYHNKRNRKLNG